MGQATAEIGQRDQVIASETQKRIAAEQQAGQTSAAAEQYAAGMQHHVSSLQDQMAARERQATLALQSQADLHSNKMSQLHLENTTMANNILSQAKADVQSVQLHKQQDIDQLVSTAELDRQQLVAQITEERANLLRDWESSLSSIVALQNQMTTLSAAMSEQGLEADRLIQLKQREILKTKQDYE